MNLLMARPDVRLDQTLQVRSQHATNALLFAVSAELTGRSPTTIGLQEMHNALGSVPRTQFPGVQLGLLLKREVKKAIANESYYRAVWREYQDLLNPMSRLSIHPWASDHCDPARVNRDTCSLETGKPCPFSDSYCANRLGAPCDHVSAALGIASRLWSDLAEAESSDDEQLKKYRCRAFTQTHLAVWVAPIADMLLNRAHTEFYQVQALLIGTLSLTKP